MARTPAVVGDGRSFARLVAKASQSQLMRIFLPIYQQMTIRNWRTTTTLLRPSGMARSARSTEAERQ